MLQYNSKKRKILKTINIDNRQYLKCRRCLRIGGNVEKAEEVEGGEDGGGCTLNEECHFTYARSNGTWSSSTALWTISTASTALYPSRGTHTTLCTSCRPPRATFAPIYSMRGLDHGCPSHRSQQAQL